LSMTEAPLHPHNLARKSFVQRNGLAQPAPSPRTLGTPPSISEPEVLSAPDAIARWSHKN
jgi:alpha-methylacyl-CoA racemase